MTKTLQQAELERIRAALRDGAEQFLQRFYRHDVLVARAVRGLQLDAVADFEREVVRPLVRQIGAGLAGFQARGVDVNPDRFPELRHAIEDAQLVIERGVAEVVRRAQESTARIGKQEADFVAASAAKTVGEPVPKPPEAKVEQAVRSRYWLGDSTERWFQKFLAQPMAEKVREEVVQGIQHGQTVDDIVRRIAGTRTQPGIIDTSRDRVAMLVRTAATAASSAARGESYKALGIAKWRFVATLDSKTSLQCAANDGKTFPVGEGPMPPLHPNCRSVSVPALGEPMGTRASIDGQVDAKKNFEQWLTERSNAEQDEVLGKTRAQSWRAGDLTLRDMLGRNLQPLTLQELRDLDRL